MIPYLFFQFKTVLSCPDRTVKAIDLQHEIRIGLHCDMAVFKHEARGDLPELIIADAELADDPSGQFPDNAAGERISLPESDDIFQIKRNRGESGPAAGVHWGKTP